MQSGLPGEVMMVGFEGVDLTPTLQKYILEWKVGGGNPFSEEHSKPFPDGQSFHRRLLRRELVPDSSHSEIVRDNQIPETEPFSQ